MEGTSFGLSKIAIKGITESTILGRKEFCDKYSPLGISESISEGFKEVDFLFLIEITMLGLTNFSKLGEDLGCKEYASLDAFFLLIEGITKVTMLGTIEGFI